MLSDYNHHNKHNININPIIYACGDLWVANFEFRVNGILYLVTVFL